MAIKNETCAVLQVTVDDAASKPVSIAASLWNGLVLALRDAKAISGVRRDGETREAVLYGQSILCWNPSDEDFIIDGEIRNGAAVPQGDFALNAESTKEGVTVKLKMFFFEDDGVETVGEWRVTTVSNAARAAREIADEVLKAIAVGCLAADEAVR